jgi:preprotein translocase subunit SecA
MDSVRIRNEITWRDVLARLRGSNVQLGLGAFDRDLELIAQHEEGVRTLPDAVLAARVSALRTELGTRSRDDLRAELYALVRDAARRTLGHRPYDVQVVAALALDAGAVVEMQTGEGKTLTATMPVTLQALDGRGAHVLTFNDYLARRDAEWMGPVYRMLGLSVGFVQQGTDAVAHRRAYAADVTYVTAKEAGFDHLRDQLVERAGDVVHRPRAFALVDEADSLLIDEARAPLVIAGRVAERPALAPGLAPLVSSLVAGVHYATDEYGRDVELTDPGLERVERALGCGSLHAAGREDLLAEVNCALHAHVLLRRDVDYIVRDGRIVIVDEFTGRVMPDRHWPDGLQSALEAKEGLERRPDGQILASMTLQRFLRGYDRLCGMTGTARDAADELRLFYGLGVVVIPTHAAARRIDRTDLVFTHREAKELAVVEEVARAHADGRPVLVGTLTVQESERLAARLRDRGVPCAVLNAKEDEHEARIVAGAGAPGAVTIATNMAGRGTDIRLGSGDEASATRVAALGGLYVIGTNRHESRRVDLQLRGRAGRQGDPGETRFFLSLDDDLTVRYGLRALIPSRYLPSPRQEPIEHPVVRREIARAQRIIEGQNVEIRRTLARYAAPLEEQYALVMERRAALLAGGEGAARLDRLWHEHLAACADLRDGIHLVRLGGQDPLQRFTTEVRAGFVRLNEALELETPLEMQADVEAPSATWTYLVNDDPFREQVLLSLVGTGGKAVAVYAAVVMPGLFLLWTLVERFWKKRKGR